MGEYWTRAAGRAATTRPVAGTPPVAPRDRWQARMEPVAPRRGQSRPCRMARRTVVALARMDYPAHSRRARPAAGKGKLLAAPAPSYPVLPLATELLWRPTLVARSRRRVILLLPMLQVVELGKRSRVRLTAVALKKARTHPRNWGRAAATKAHPTSQVVAVVAAAAAHPRFPPVAAPRALPNWQARTAVAPGAFPTRLAVAAAWRAPLPMPPLAAAERVRSTPRPVVEPTDYRRLPLLQSGSAILRASPAGSFAAAATNPRVRCLPRRARHSYFCSSLRCG